MNAGQRFARIATDVVVRRPALWRVFRGPLRRAFDRLAPVWDGMRLPDSFAPVEAGLAALPTAPQRVLDLGTGTGAVAGLVADRFPEADVTGVDLSPKMIEVARGKGTRVRFEVADAERLWYGDGAFDLVTLGNMIPFFDELARVTASRGHVLLAFSGGDQTPIYVPPERLRAELGSRGFVEFADFSAGRGTALLARKR
jgi:SAM-dependent methyltransferase